MKKVKEGVGKKKVFLAIFILLILVGGGFFLGGFVLNHGPSELDNAVINGSSGGSQIDGTSEAQGLQENYSANGAPKDASDSSSAGGSETSGKDLPSDSKGGDAGNDTNTAKDNSSSANGDSESSIGNLNPISSFFGWIGGLFSSKKANGVSCTSDSQCESEYCEFGVKANGICSEVLVIPLIDNPNLPNYNLSSIGCKTDSDCDNEKFCLNGSCNSLPPAKSAKSCKNDYDCDSGLTCNSGYCYKFACTTDSQCSDGDTCQQGYCSNYLPPAKTAFVLSCNVSDYYLGYSSSGAKSCSYNNGTIRTNNCVDQSKLKYYKCEGNTCAEYVKACDEIFGTEDGAMYCKDGMCRISLECLDSTKVTLSSRGIFSNEYTVWEESEDIAFWGCRGSDGVEVKDSCRSDTIVSQHTCSGKYGDCDRTTTYLDCTKFGADYVCSEGMCVDSGVRH